MVHRLCGLDVPVDRGISSGTKVRFMPCLPADWNGFELRYRYGKTIYHIAVSRADERKIGMEVTIDGEEQIEKMISLVDDGKEHKVEILI